VAKRREFREEGLAVVALDFDDAVLDRAARAAFLLETLGQGIERRLVQSQTRDERHALAFAALGLARNAHDAVSGGRGPFSAAAGVGGLAATRTHPPALRGIDDARTS